MVAEKTAFRALLVRPWSGQINYGYSIAFHCSPIHHRRESNEVAYKTFKKLTPIPGQSIAFNISVFLLAVTRRMPVLTPSRVRPEELREFPSLPGTWRLYPAASSVSLADSALACALALSALRRLLPRLYQVTMENWRYIIPGFGTCSVELLAGAGQPVTHLCYTSKHFCGTGV